MATTSASEFASNMPSTAWPLLVIALYLYFIGLTYTMYFLISSLSIALFKAISLRISPLLYRSTSDESMVCILCFPPVCILVLIWWIFSSLIRFLIAGVAIMISWAATLPLPSALGSSCWDITAWIIEDS